MLNVAAALALSPIYIYTLRFPPKVHIALVKFTICVLLYSVALIKFKSPVLSEAKQYIYNIVQIMLLVNCVLLYILSKIQHQKEIKEHSMYVEFSYTTHDQYGQIIEKNVTQRIPIPLDVYPPTEHEALKKFLEQSWTELQFSAEKPTNMIVHEIIQVNQ
jgi:hypothetical protein